MVDPGGPQVTEGRHHTAVGWWALGEQGHWGSSCLTSRTGISRHCDNFYAALVRVCFVAALLVANINSVPTVCPAKHRESLWWCFWDACPPDLAGAWV